MRRDDHGMERDEPHRSRRWVVAGIALLTTAVAAAGLVVTLGGDDDEPADVLPSPRSITRDGVTYDVGLTAPAAATLDPADPRAVTIYAFAAEHPEQPECATLEPQARVVEETATTVRIATYAYAVPVEGDEPVSCFFTSEPGADYRAMTVRLREPLGERRIVDEKSDEDIGRLDPAYEPTPTYVPRGFRSSPPHPMAPEGISAFTPEGGFTAISQLDRDDGASLEIRVRSATAWSESGTVLSRDRVGDHEATVTEEDYQRCASWAPRAGLVAEVCSLGSAFLPPEELLRIARGVPEP